jgi:hypothetical protein
VAAALGLGDQGETLLLVYDGVGVGGRPREVGTEAGAVEVLAEEEMTSLSCEHEQRCW